MGGERKRREEEIDEPNLKFKLASLLGWDEFYD
jgi:hypothetical protein